ncbi:MAG: hypothetical protein AAGC76_20000 [Luteibacter sp.]|uniref:hypothetical protein n=1 Tax=Luteibacter sp. TaxID=1886636 RepID=UPI002809ABB6|nr:hypothetical protein [Luteibacter sp.]MDQ7998133.1 hypothetical protein [Luteibacter sp.]
MQGLTPLGLTILCFGLGMLGSLIGAWFCTRRSAAQLDASWQALEQDREKVQHDMRLASLCVPQWVQQAVRLEFERLDRKQSERWGELLREQLRWQAEQDVLRRREWLALGGGAGSGDRMKAGASPGASGRSARAPGMPVQPPRAHGPESQAAPAAAPLVAPEPPGHELSDAEIDALPPDLPAPARFSGKKLPAPKGRVLRNI